MLKTALASFKLLKVRSMKPMLFCKECGSWLFKLPLIQILQQTEQRFKKKSISFLKNCLVLEMTLSSTHKSFLMVPLVEHST